MELCHAVLTSLLHGPALDHWTLPNGVRCVAAEMPEAPLTCLDLWCRAGSFTEAAGEEGMAHFLEHMVFKGSERLEAGAFDLAIEALGGSSNAATGFDDVHFHVLIPPETSQQALDLLLDLVLHPALEQESFRLEREVVLEEMAQYADQPDELVLQQLLKQGCPDHPYGRPILGERSSLLAMDPEAMRTFHERRYRGHHCCLAISGPKARELRATVESSALAQLPPDPQPSADAMDQVEPRGLRLQPGRHTMELARLESARLLMLWSGSTAHDQAWVMGADLATTLLGEGRRSRLVAQLREELRIAESVDMDLSVLEQGCLMTLEISCEPEDLEQVEATVHEQLAQAAQFSAEELARGRQLVGNGLRYSLESVGQVAAQAASQMLWNRPQELLQPLQHLQAWTEERLSEDLMPLLQPSRACSLIATPAGQR